MRLPAVLAVVPSAAIAETILPWDPTNVPSEDWPGKDAKESNAAWPTGQQPASLVAWEMNDDRPEPCWKLSILHDTGLGWPGQCDGLDKVSTEKEEECEESCRKDPTCGVWQFTNSSECFHGQGFHCDDRGSRGRVEVRRAQRLQHGDVRVLRDMTGWDVSKLRSLGLWRTGNVTDGVRHCRNYCYSQIYCQYWQYGEGGCYVEDPRSEFLVIKDFEVQYPLTTNGGATQNSDFARTAIAGEYIQHICPARSLVRTTVHPVKEVMGIRERRWQLLGGIFALVLAISLCGWLSTCWCCLSHCCQGRQKRKRSASADLLQPEEDEEASSYRSEEQDHKPQATVAEAPAARQDAAWLAELQERRPPGRAAAPFSYMPLDTRPPPERLRSMPPLNAPLALRLPPPDTHLPAGPLPTAVRSAPATMPSLQASQAPPVPQASMPTLRVPTLPVPRLPVLASLQTHGLPDPAPQVVQVSSSSVSLPPRQRPMQHLRFYSFQ